MRFEIDDSEIAKLINITTDGICVPVLRNVIADTKSNIAEMGMKYKGASDLSVGSPESTMVNPAVSELSRKRLIGTIRPILSKQEAFLNNLYGYDVDRLVYVRDDPELKKWVELKYQGRDKQAILENTSKLKIRSKSSTGIPLGHPDRNFFEKGLAKTIQNKTRYGLT